MFRTLVVPLDGSKLAEGALPYALRLAEADEGRLVLVRAANAPVPDRIDGVDRDKDKSDAVAEARRYLAEVADSITPGVPVETVVSSGRPANEILNAVADHSADGVVMATRGRTGMPHLMVGSVAESILARSQVPVLLVHTLQGAEASEPFDPHAAQLIVPLDGSSFAEAALEPAVQLVGPAGELVLVCITLPPQHVLMDANRQRVVSYLDQQEAAQTREAHDYLDGVAQRLRTTYPGKQISIHTHMADDAASGIVNAASERAADLVVMATHGRTGLRRAVMGSVAGEVLRTGSTPLLLVGPGAQHVESASTGSAYEVTRR